MTKICRTIFALLCLVRFESRAGIGEDLEAFFQELGMTTNSTTPGAHRDQSAGYYSGGGLSVRSRAKNARIATLSLPSVSAGCGGIDMFLGGFSHIKKDALIQALRSIGSEAAGYAFKLSLKTIAPMIDGVIEDLNDLATKINQADINSCETASTLLGGVWPKSDLTSRHLCASMGAGLGDLSDWAAARQGCGVGGERPRMISQKSSRPGYQDMLVEEFNVAWEVIKKNDFLKSNRDLAHLCMTLAGTIVSYREEGRGRVVAYPSKADRDDMIKVLFEGGRTDIYSCADAEKCLRINTVKQTIPSAKAFMMKVRKVLGDLGRKAMDDEAFSPQEIAFIENVRLPLYKMINVMSAYKRSEFDLRDFTEIVAVDFIHQYITEILDVMLEEAANLRNAQISEEEISRFIKQLQEAKTNIAAKRTTAYRQMNQALIMIETTKTYERKIENAFDDLQKGQR